MAVLIALHVVSALVYWTGAGDALGLEFWHIAMLDLDEEESFGTWFSAAILGFASLLAFLQAQEARRSGGRMPRAWWLLGLGFAGLSLDEVAGVHEYLNTWSEDVSWTGFGAIVAGAAAVGFLPFLWRLPLQTRILFVAAGSLYLGGALGVERFTDSYDSAQALNTLSYNLWNTLEEGLEMGGIVLFLYAQIAHMAGGAEEGLVLTTELRSGLPAREGS